MSATTVKIPIDNKALTQEEEENSRLVPTIFGMVFLGMLGFIVLGLITWLAVAEMKSWG